MDWTTSGSTGMDGSFNSALAASAPIEYADDGVDYASGSGTLHFTSNGNESDYVRVISVTGLPIPAHQDDPDNEDLEVFFIKLYNPRSSQINVHITGVNPYPVFIIEDDDPIS